MSNPSPALSDNDSTLTGAKATFEEEDLTGHKQKKLEEQSIAFSSRYLAFSSSPSKTKCSSTYLASLLEPVAESFFESVKPFLKESDLELELRLIYFRDYEVRPSYNSSSSAIGSKRLRDNFSSKSSDIERPLKRVSVVPDVHKGDFEKILTFIRSGLSKSSISSNSNGLDTTNQTSQPEQVLEHTVSEDIATPQGRLSFAINADGSSTFVKQVQKSKLVVRDITLPDTLSPYSLRICLSKEKEVPNHIFSEATGSDSAQPSSSPSKESFEKMFRRRKERTTLCKGDSFVYDLTVVSSTIDSRSCPSRRKEDSRGGFSTGSFPSKIPAKRVTHEVEIEFHPKTENEERSNPSSTLPIERLSTSAPTSLFSHLTEKDICDLLYRGVELATLDDLVGMKNLTKDGAE